jgi:hypothetical protein
VALFRQLLVDSGDGLEELLVVLDGEGDALLSGMLVLLWVAVEVGGRGAYLLARLHLAVGFVVLADVDQGLLVVLVDGDAAVVGKLGQCLISNLNTTWIPQLQLK